MESEDDNIIDTYLWGDQEHLFCMFPGCELRVVIFTLAASPGMFTVTGSQFQTGSTISFPDFPIQIESLPSHFFLNLQTERDY